MTHRHFRVVTDADGPPLKDVYPPTPELYEELCRAEVERAARIAEAHPDRFLGDSSARLSGRYPTTVVVLAATLGGSPAELELDLYRPHFHRMRNGRLAAASEWFDVVESILLENRWWLDPDNDDAYVARVCWELLDIASAFGVGLSRRGRIEATGAGRARRIRLVLVRASAELVIETPIWSQDQRRSIWEIAEDLRSSALDAVGARPEDEPPVLTLGVSQYPPPHA
jgi:hypothetical protein